MSQKSTIWELDSQSLGKHLVLRRYLDAWFPIMGSQNQRILFIDGYAGPGEYQDGEKGSPLIALEAYKEHSSLHIIKAEVCFIFIEKDKKRAENLENLIKSIENTLPQKCRTMVVNGVFDEELTQVFDMLDNQKNNMAPAFVMIDPFGISKTPMKLIQRILSNPKSEVYITYMSSSIIRFISTPEFENQLDEFYGCGDWRQVIPMNNSEQRKKYLYKLYEDQLRKAGAEYVVHYELYKGNKLIYAIFFGTKNVTGCERMKQAIWKVVPWGDFAFHGTKSQQLTMGLEKPNFEPLKQNLRQKYQGLGWVSIEELEKYVASDKTEYLVSHLRKGALIPMEKDMEIEVDEETRNRKRTYPPGTSIRFI